MTGKEVVTHALAGALGASIALGVERLWPSKAERMAVMAVEARFVEAHERATKRREEFDSEHQFRGIFSRHFRKNEPNVLCCQYLEKAGSSVLQECLEIHRAEKAAFNARETAVEEARSSLSGTLSKWLREDKNRQ